MKRIIKKLFVVIMAVLFVGMPMTGCKDDEVDIFDDKENLIVKFVIPGADPEVIERTYNELPKNPFYVTLPWREEGYEIDDPTIWYNGEQVGGVDHWSWFKWRNYKDGSGEWGAYPAIVLKATGKYSRRYDLYKEELIDGDYYGKTRFVTFSLIIEIVE